MKFNKLLFALIFFGFLTSNIWAQKTVTLLKRLDDDAGRYGLKLVPIFEDGAGNADKQKAMEPFVIAYFGWKAKKLTEFGVGKIEAAHLNICRVMLNQYDSELDSTLQAVTARAKTPVDWVDVPESEQKAIHGFVVIKYSGKFTGMSDILQGKQPQINENDKWKSNLGAGLGELSGSLVNWYKFPTSASYPKNISELLLNLQKTIDEAPRGTSAKLLANLRTLSALGKKTAVTEAERDQVAAALREALYSTLGFIGMEGSAL